MNRIDFLKDQSTSTRKITKDLLSDIPDDLWYTIPDVINTNIAWQVGHLTISQFFNGISVIVGFNKGAAEAFPIRKYSEQFTPGMTPDVVWELKPSPSEFMENLNKLNEVALSVLDTLKEIDLDAPLEPTKFPHPLATTKWESLTWNFRHESWHAGQISMIKRVLGKPTDVFRRKRS